MWHMKTVGSAPIEKSFPSVASQRDVGTIVLLLRSKRKSRMLRLERHSCAQKSPCLGCRDLQSFYSRA